MPTVLRESGYRFFFFSNETREPPHVHVRKGDAYAKVWLSTQTVADSRHLSPSQLRTILAIVEDNASQLRAAWDEYFDH